MLRSEWVRGPELFQSHHSAWDELFNAAPNCTPFQSWEWQHTWFRHFSGGKSPLALAIWEGHELVAWWPMVQVQSPWVALRSMGGGPSDYLHPLVRRDEPETWEAILCAIDESQFGKVVDLHQLRADFAPGLLQSPSVTPLSNKIEQARCLVLDLPPTYDAYVKGLSKSLRYDVRRLGKPPFSTGVAQIYRATEDSLTEALEAFFMLHEKRWRKKWQPGAFPARIKRFHRDWAPQALATGQLALDTLRLDGKAIGSLYGLRHGGTTYFYQAGIDPEYHALSPGTLLVANAIRTAIESGDTRFDFLRGAEPYKRRWQPQHEYVNSRILNAKPGLVGQAGLQVNLLGSRVEAWVRARLE